MKNYNSKDNILGTEYSKSVQEVKTKILCDCQLHCRYD